MNLLEKGDMLMSRTLFSKAATACAAAAAFGFLAFSAAPAEAKQCVWNKGAFVLRVDWFKPGTVTANTNPTDHFTEFTFTEQPVQTDSIWSASGRCINRGPTAYRALLSVCGGINRTRVLAYPAEWPESNRIDCSIFMLVDPSTTRYLDVWGSVLEAATGPGGPI